MHHVLVWYVTFWRRYLWSNEARHAVNSLTDRLNCKKGGIEKPYE